MPAIDYSHMTPTEKLDLIGEIWDSLSESAGEIPATHREELDRRLADADANPDAVIPWEVARARLRDRR